MTAYLTIWLVLLFAIPGSLVVGAFGGTGQPALLFSLLAPLWWLAGRAVPTLDMDRQTQPLRVALLIYAGYMIASYGISGTRTLSPLEFDASNREMIRLFSNIGLALLVADGMRDFDRFRTLLRRLVWLSGAFAAVGIAQFFTGEFIMPVPTWLSGWVPRVQTRSGFYRPPSTSMHPIEYAVIVAAMLPLSLHYFFYARSQVERNASLLATTLLVLAVPISLSRTGVVSLAAAMMVVALGWSWRRRANSLMLFLLAIPAFAAAVPGVLDVMIDLFSNIDQDTSIQGRLNRLPAVTALIQERPWFGLGYGTWTADTGFLLDNQLWATMLESGYLGLTLTILLPVVAAVVAMTVGRLPSATEESRHLGFAIAGAIAGLGISLLTFDAFFYRILTSLFFLLIGCSGALWQLSRRAEHHVGHG